MIAIIIRLSLKKPMSRKYISNRVWVVWLSFIAETKTFDGAGNILFVLTVSWGEKEKDNKTSCQHDEVSKKMYYNLTLHYMGHIHALTWINFNYKKLAKKNVNEPLLQISQSKKTNQTNLIDFSFHEQPRLDESHLDWND